MTLSVMLEQLDNNSFRATACAPVSVVAEAMTRERAVERIRTLVQERLARADLIQLEVPNVDMVHDSWARFAGCLRDRPDAAEVEQNMKDYRREVDSDPLRL